MFTIENRINGVLIGVLYGHNEGFGDDLTNYRYSWHYHDIEAGTVKSGSITHRRADGLVALTAAILADIVKQNGKSARKEKPPQRRRDTVGATALR